MSITINILSIGTVCQYTYIFRKSVTFGCFIHGCTQVLDHGGINMYTYPGYGANTTDLLQTNGNIGARVGLEPIFLPFRCRHPTNWTT